jgi:hypothetical protein
VTQQTVTKAENLPAEALHEFGQGSFVSGKPSPDQVADFVWQNVTLGYRLAGRQVIPKKCPLGFNEPRCRAGEQN